MMIRYFAVLAGLVAFPIFSSNAQPLVAPWCGEFLPMVTESWGGGGGGQYVHFVPKYCNKIMVNGVIETIPPGTAVLSGGVEADLKNTCIDKVCGQALAPNMVWRTYVYKDGAALRASFSVKEHKEDQTYGNEVHTDDPSQSFIGLLYTDANGEACPSSLGLCVLSWFYRGHTGISHWIGPLFGQPIAQACDTPGGGLVPVDGFDVLVLTFEVNSTFRQGYTVPNFYLSGTMMNTVVDRYVHAAIGIEWGGTPVAFSTGAPGVVHWTRNFQAPSAAIQFRTTGTLPAPLVPNTTYYVRTLIGTDAFTLAETPGGPEIALSGTQAGNHIMVKPLSLGGPRVTHWKNSPSDAGPIGAMAVGALAAEEGFIRAKIMLGTPNGGCAVIPEGILTTSPHHS